MEDDIEDASAYWSSTSGTLKTLSTYSGIYNMKDAINNYAIESTENLPESIRESAKSAIIDEIIKKNSLEKYYDENK